MVTRYRWQWSFRGPSRRPCSLSHPLCHGCHQQHKNPDPATEESVLLHKKTTSNKVPSSWASPLFAFAPFPIRKIIYAWYADGTKKCRSTRVATLWWQRSQCWFEFWEKNNNLQDCPDDPVSLGATRRQGRGEGIKQCRIAHLMRWLVGNTDHCQCPKWYHWYFKGSVRTTWAQDNGQNMAPGRTEGEENEPRWEGRKGGWNMRPLPHSGITRLTLRQARPT